MARAVVMPKLGLTMTEGLIGEWKVKEGDTVKKGDILFSVETDKLSNDIEADQDGVVLKILVKAGETVPCKEVLAYIGNEGEIIPDNPLNEESAVNEREPESSFSEGKSDPAAAKPEGNRSVKASPKAKKIAEENKIDISQVKGTGPNGRITAEDVESFIAGAATAQIPEESLKTSPVAAKMAEEKEPEPVKAGMLRRSIAANMSKSWITSPMVSYTRPVDCTMMKKMREDLKPEYEAEGLTISFNHILMYIVSRVLTEFPDVNSSYADDVIIRHRHVNMGLAVVKDDGLIVPNVKNADTKSLKQISEETQKLIEKTRSGKLTSEEMTGGTFTITNLGSYGITAFSPIINQPELAILGICDIVDTPVAVDGIVTIRPMMNLALTADHRLIDGTKAAQFLKRVCDMTEAPFRML